MSLRFLCHLRFLRHGTILGFLFLLHGWCAAEEPKAMVVHEWGTFTALQDERGLPLVGINVDTEPVPHFVHNLGRFILNDAVLSTQHWVHRQKAVPRNHPRVSLRLETPVIYFYPPAGMPLPQRLDVEVKFRGGWLTEFYPRPEIQFPVVEKGEFQFQNLTPATVGQITWRDLQVGTTEPGPETTEPVWLAPRNVAAASVTTPEGEHEKYLFYRGVANRSAPLQVVTADQGQSIEVWANFQNLLEKDQSTTIENLWLLESRSDGTCAYRQLPKVVVTNDGKVPQRITSLRKFGQAQFSKQNQAKLEVEMYAALLRDGLFADEAKALLSTWQQAYFTSPGLRIFYTVPRAWTDFYLPLSISVKSEITRVMIGRVELISDHQRQLLSELEQTPLSDGKWLIDIPWDSQALKGLLAGRLPQTDIGVVIPKDFQIYLDLGRFRNALVAAQQSRTRSSHLSNFIQTYELEPFRISQISGK